MGDPFAAAETALVDGLGTDALYVGANGTKDVRGIFSHAHQRVESSRGAAISSRRPEFSIARSALDFEPLQGDTIKIGSTLFEIASIRPDEEDTQLTFGLKRV